MWRMCLRTSDSSGYALFSHTHADRGDPSVGGPAVHLASLLLSRSCTHAQTHCFHISASLNLSSTDLTALSWILENHMEVERLLHNILNQSLQITLECFQKVASHNCLECSGFGLFNHNLALCLFYNSPERYPSCMVEQLTLKSYFVSENLLHFVEFGRSV